MTQHLYTLQNYHYSRSSEDLPITYIVNIVNKKNVSSCDKNF